MTKLVRDLSTAATALIVLTAVLGLAYPLVVTGIAQVAFHGRANGEQVKVNGKVVGSKLIAQPANKRPGDFQPRPSADDYNPSATFFGNHGPNQASTRDLTRHAMRAYLAPEKRDDAG